MKFDDFMISFKPLANSTKKSPTTSDQTIEEQAVDLQFNAVTRHSRLPVVGGLFSSRAASEPFDAQKAQQLQEDYRKTLERAHTWSARNMPGTPPSATRSLELGLAIAKVLPENMRIGIIQAAVQARQRRRVLRVILDFHPSATALIGIPWELIVLSIHDLHQPNVEDFLLLDPWITLVRQIRGVGIVVPTRFTSPLRIETLVAQPRGVHPINVTAIHAVFKEISAWKAEHWYADHATIETLYQRLTTHQPAILHLICHGGKSNTPQGDRYDLLLNHEKGFIRRAGAAELGPILTLANIQLVVLHACYGGVQGQTPEDQRAAIEGVALGLLRRGIPLVVAFQGEVSQDAATVFTKSLYQQLDQGIPLEYAITRARLAIHAYVPQALLDWSLPVIYRGSEDRTMPLRIQQLSNWIEVGIENRLFHQAVRLGFISLALLLLFLALMYALVLPLRSMAQIADSFTQFLIIMTLMGMIAPAIIAMLYTTTYRTSQLKSKAKKQVILTQWAAAYLGYAVGYMNALLFYFSLFLLLGQAVTSLLGAVTISGFMVGLALLYSYIGMRIQVRGAWALAEESPELFNNAMIALLVLVSAAIILGIPLIIIQSLLPNNSFLFQAAPLSFILGTGLLMLVIAFSD